jgi:hypothetical protein
MRRRLELEYTEGHGIQYLPIIKQVFAEMRPDVDFTSQSLQYIERMRTIDGLLGK